MFLKLKEYDKVITRAKESIDKEDWNENDLKAVNLIYSTIWNKKNWIKSTIQLEFLCKETAYKKIKKLDDMYLKESTAIYKL